MVKTRRLLLSAVAVLVPPLLCQPRNVPGFEMNGQVVDESGRPAMGKVTVFRLLRPSDGQEAKSYKPVPVNRMTTTGGDGRFSFSDLPVGEYRICARTVKFNQIGTCEWSESVPPVKIGEQPVQQIPPLVLREAGLISIRVARQSVRTVFPLDLKIGVLSESGFYNRAVLSASDSSELVSVYRVSVPYGVPVSLLIHSGVPILDRDAKAIPLRLPYLKLTVSKSVAEQGVELRLN